MPLILLAGAGAGGGALLPPTGGAGPAAAPQYLFPLIAPGWLRGGAPNLTALLAPLERSIDQCPATLASLRVVLELPTATGTDLDAIGARVGVARLYLESDTQYRARIPAVVQAAGAALSLADMTTALTAIYGVETTVADTSGTAGFMITFLGAVTYPQTVLPTVKSFKAAGTVPHARMLAQTGPPVVPGVGVNLLSGRPVMGAARAGSMAAAGGGGFLTLF